MVRYILILVDATAIAIKKRPSGEGRSLVMS
jgi:hypothetical protein